MAVLAPLILGSKSTLIVTPSREVTAQLGAAFGLSKADGVVPFLRKSKLSGR